MRKGEPKECTHAHSCHVSLVSLILLSLSYIITSQNREDKMEFECSFILVLVFGVCNKQQLA